MKRIHLLYSFFIYFTYTPMDVVTCMYSTNQCRENLYINKAMLVQMFDTQQLLVLYIVLSIEIAYS